MVSWPTCSASAGVAPCLTGGVSRAILRHANPQRTAPDPGWRIAARLLPPDGPGRRGAGPAPRVQRGRARLRGTAHAATGERNPAQLQREPARPVAGGARRDAKLGAEEGRYAFQADKELRARIAELEGLRPEYVETFNGSSDPLHRAVLAFTGPSRAYVYGEPGFEAGWQAAKISGAPAIAVPLTPTLAHDASAMCAASPTPGLLYICNPNNPTGTTTPRDADRLGAGEQAGRARSCWWTRPTSTSATRCRWWTWSMRMGTCWCCGPSPSSTAWQGFGWGWRSHSRRCSTGCGRSASTISSITGVTAARISVDDPTLVPTRRAYTKQAREETFAFLTKYGYGFHPSVSNCFMLDAKRPAGELATAMAAAERADRTDVAGVAQLCPGDGGHPGRNEAVLHRAPGGDRLAAEPAAAPAPAAAATTKAAAAEATTAASAPAPTGASATEAAATTAAPGVEVRVAQRRGRARRLVAADAHSASPRCSSRRCPPAASHCRCSCTRCHRGVAYMLLFDSSRWRVFPLAVSGVSAPRGIPVLRRDRRPIRTVRIGVLIALGAGAGARVVGLRHAGGAIRARSPMHRGHTCRW